MLIYIYIYIYIYTCICVFLCDLTSHNKNEKPTESGAFCGNVNEAVASNPCQTPPSDEGFACVFYVKADTCQWIFWHDFVSMFAYSHRVMNDILWKKSYENGLFVCTCQKQDTTQGQFLSGLIFRFFLLDR